MYKIECKHLIEIHSGALTISSITNFPNGSDASLEKLPLNGPIESLVEPLPIYSIPPIYFASIIPFNIFPTKGMYFIDDPLPDIVA